MSTQNSGFLFLTDLRLGNQMEALFHFFHVLRATGGVGSDAALNGVENTASSNAGK